MNLVLIISCLEDVRTSSPFQFVLDWMQDCIFSFICVTRGSCLSGIRFLELSFLETNRYIYCDNSGSLFPSWCFSLEHLRLFRFIFSVMGCLLFVFTCLSVWGMCPSHFFSSPVRQWAVESFQLYILCVCVCVCVRTYIAWQDTVVKVTAMSSGMTGNNEPSQVQ